MEESLLDTDILSELLRGKNLKVLRKGSPTDAVLGNTLPLPSMS